MGYSSQWVCNVDECISLDKQTELRFSALTKIRVDFNKSKFNIFFLDVIAEREKIVDALRQLYRP